MSKKFMWPCLDIVFMYAFDDEIKWRSVEREVSDLIVSLDFNGDYKIGTMDIYHFEASCLKLIDRHGSLVVGLVLDKVFSLIYSNISAQWESAASSLIEKLIEKKQYQKVLERISLALPNRSPIEKFDIENFFGSKGFREDDPLLLRFPHDLLIEWMSNGPHEVRIFVAKSCPLYLNQGAEFIVHPLAEKIVNLFGDDMALLKGLSSFAGIKGWSGSRIPDLEGEKTAYQHFARSDLPTVSHWAQEFLEYTVKSIEAESRKEDARDFGIH
ncbi:hypothetical protein [Marinobacter salsuginis]|uniref:hypothetical protein n=1 Tax=Marinobacter salsuginis TaxID=418719 RepID=UPI001AE0D851|nr:hypothetical protein [Marinobacter salsuginis]QTN40725.1 hypothetical protein HZ997_13620 [Marinobacter salsuginis]